MKPVTTPANSGHGAQLPKANCTIKPTAKPIEPTNGLHSKKHKAVTEKDSDDNSVIKEFTETYTDAIKKDGNELTNVLQSPLNESEVVDQQEEIGNAEEENNSYTIRIDNHNQWDDNRE